MPKFKFGFSSLIVLWLGLLIYSVWSFGLTDPNLVFTSWPPYWQFQTWLWQNLFKQPIWLTTSYLVSLVWIWSAFGWVWHQSLNWHFTWKQWALIWALTVSPLLISNNALSHDVFNYVFNAKMVLIYHANPHVQVALDFANDPITRFMHNTHTPAPYGYGWTIFSLIPSLLGLNKFVLTWWLFKIINLVGVIGLIWVLIKLHSQLFSKSISPRDLVLVIFNPLLMIELIGNSHNDIWLVLPAMLSLYLVTNWANPKPKLKQLFLSLALLGFSISTKLATVLLVPIWITTLAWPFPTSEKLRHQITTELNKLSGQLGEKISWAQFWPLLSSVMLFLPLMTGRSQQFHPWYLVWVLAWLPLIRLNWWRQIILAFSVSSLLRYVPWLWAGNYTTDVLAWQKQITWLIPLIWLLVIRGREQFKFQREQT